MSNFTCPECGTQHIDCGRQGYHTAEELKMAKRCNQLGKKLCKALSILEHCKYMLEDGLAGALEHDEAAYYQDLIDKINKLSKGQRK